MSRRPKFRLGESVDCFHPYWFALDVEVTKIRYIKLHELVVSVRDNMTGRCGEPGYYYELSHNRGCGVHECWLMRRQPPLQKATEREREETMT